MALVICLALMAGGCSAKEETAPAGDTETSGIEENAAESTETGVYAELTQKDTTIEITPIPGGITDSTVLPTFKCTFGEMTNEAQNALEEGRVFPKEFFRDLTACMLISEEMMTGRDHEAIMYETGDDGTVVRSIYNVHFGSGDKDGQIIYDNQTRKWYLGDAEYSGSIDSEDTLAVWWTIFDIADGNIQ